MFQPYNHTSNLSFSKTPACSEISLNLLAATEALSPPHLATRTNR